jgi:hypothetical protein
LVLSNNRPGRARRDHQPEYQFLSKPAARDLLADARLLKLGKRLAVAEVTMRSDGDDTIVAHATVTYSIPRASRAPERGVLPIGATAQ